MICTHHCSSLDIIEYCHCPKNPLYSTYFSFPSLPPSFLPSSLPPSLLPSPDPLLSFFFLGTYLLRMEVPRLQLLAYTMGTAIPGLSCICNLCCSLQKYQILNPLSEARDWSCILRDTRQVLNLLSHNGNYFPPIFKLFFFILNTSELPGIKKKWETV